MRILNIHLWLLLFVTSLLHAQTPSFPSEKKLKNKKPGELITKLGQYRASKADWGYLLVPENRQHNKSQLLRLAIVRQRASEKATLPPIFNLVGGPGKSNIWGSGDFEPRFYEQNDIVRVGYRGIDSNIELTCPEFLKALQTDKPLQNNNIKQVKYALRACNNRLRAEGIDVDGYNLAEVVQDIEATRKALGYKQINLFAVSWGTQIAYAYAMHYPQRVNRMLLVAAGGRTRGFNLWNPGMVDKILKAYAELWKKDPKASARSPDILKTIRKVLTTLLKSWRDISIDPDKVRLSFWDMLDSTKNAALVFDAFVAAEKGDYAGLALLSWSYDHEIQMQLKQKHGPFYGEFFSKVMSSGLDHNRLWIREMDPPESIIGSPNAKLLWGAASGVGFNQGWPIKMIPGSYRWNKVINTETLVLMGNLDVSSPVEYVQHELMPYLKRGKLTVLSNMGHVEFISQQPDAFNHLAYNFFYNGKVDASKFIHQEIDFSPQQTLQKQAYSDFDD